MADYGVPPNPPYENRLNLAALASDRALPAAGSSLPRRQRIARENARVALVLAHLDQRAVEGVAQVAAAEADLEALSLIHISEPTRPY